MSYLCKTLVVVLLIVKDKKKVLRINQDGLIFVTGGSMCICLVVNCIHEVLYLPCAHSVLCVICNVLFTYMDVLCQTCNLSFCFSDISL